MQAAVPCAAVCAPAPACGAVEEVPEQLVTGLALNQPALTAEGVPARRVKRHAFDVRARVCAAVRKEDILEQLGRARVELGDLLGRPGRTRAWPGGGSFV